MRVVARVVGPAWVPDVAGVCIGGCGGKAYHAPWGWRWVGTKMVPLITTVHAFIDSFIHSFAHLCISSLFFGQK